MIRYRYRFLILMAVILSMLFVGCGKNSGDKLVGGADSKCTSDNVAIQKLEAGFREELGKSSELIPVTDAVIEQATYIPFSLACMQVEEGFLNGFDSEILGFKTGVCFGPVIGTMPFVGYIFETDDPAALVNTLEKNANLRWNICTEADEMHSEILDDSHVFFIMCQKEFEE